MSRRRREKKTEAFEFVLGFDDDDPTLHQFVHLAFERPGGSTVVAHKGPTSDRVSMRTLCNSERLWFTTEILTDPDFPRFSIERVDCPYCLMIARHQP